MTPELRAAISAGNKRKWEDPDYRRRNTESHRGLTFAGEPARGFYLTKNGGYRVITGLQGHPLADRAGGVPEHRKVLYEKIGPGPHPCHWHELSGCGKLALTWGGTEGIQADHLDGVPLNNSPENLVPSCRACNWRGMRLGGDRPTNQNVLKTRCPLRHPLAGSNLEPWALSKGRRRCKACHRAHGLVRKYPEKEFAVEAHRIYAKLKS